MKHDGRIKGKGPCAPPGKVKKRKKPSDEGMRDLGPKRDTKSMIDLTFTEDLGVLSAVLEGMPVMLSPDALQQVSSGETWKCMVQANMVTHRLEAFPCVLVSEAPPVAEDEPPADLVDEIVPGPEQPGPDAPAAVDGAPEAKCSGQTMIIRQLKADKDRLESENESLRRDLRKATDTNSSLSAQVNALNRKSDTMSSLSVESEVMSLKDTIESQDLEISRLREKLKSMGIDDLAVTPRLPKVPKATLTGTSSISCTVLQDGRYTVLVNPRKCKVRVIPDKDGRVACTGGMLHIGGISMFSKFEKPRPLTIMSLADGIEITL